MTPINSSSKVFGSTGADQTYTVPNGVTSLLVQMWGGGGGGGSGQYAGGGDGQQPNANGAAHPGGTTSGTLSVTPGEVLTIVVGKGGTTGGGATYGGGGAGGTGSYQGGGGGGRSAIKAGGVELMTAGGAGGGGGGDNAARFGFVVGFSSGQGGGSSGATTYGESPQGVGGTGGSQTAGGAGGANGGVNGSSGTGGAGGGGSGGGGGGHFGGGGGGTWSSVANAGGGGGSGYCGGAGVSNCTTSTDYGGTSGVYSSFSGCSGGCPGGGGLVILTQTNPSAPTITGPSTGSIGTTYSFVVGNSTDPANAKLRYGIDWNMDGVVDAWSPSTATLSGGTTVTVTHSWASVGSMNFQVLAQNASGLNSAWTQASITIQAPQSTCNVSLSPSTILNGGTSQLSYSSTNSTQMYINNVGYVTPDTSGSFTVAPSATTDYTCTASYNGYAYTTATTPATLTVNYPPACTISASPSSLSQGQSATVSWTSSNATSISIPALGGSLALSGSQSVTPNTSTTYTGTVSGPGGTASCTVPSGQTNTVTVSCTPAYSCSGNTIMYKNAQCSNSAVTSCVAPQYCATGSSICFGGVMQSQSFFDGNGNSRTGDLQVAPSLVRTDSPVTLYWQMQNALSCTVTGTNGFSASGVSSGTGGVQTGPITQQVIFTLQCTSITGATPPSLSEPATVNVVPTFREP